MAQDFCDTGTLWPAVPTLPSSSCSWNGACLADLLSLQSGLGGSGGHAKVLYGETECSFGVSVPPMC